MKIELYFAQNIFFIADDIIVCVVASISLPASIGRK